MIDLTKNTLIQRQQGASLIGMLAILILIVLVAFLALKIVPLYQEKHAVKSAMEQVAEANKGQSPQQVQNALIRQLDLNYVSGLDKEAIKVTRDRITVQYEPRASLFMDMAIVLEFNESVSIR